MAEKQALIKTSKLSARWSGGNRSLSPCEATPVAVVEIVSFACAELASGVTEVWLKVQLVPRGREEHPSDTAELNAPPCGLTVMVYEAELPAVTLELVGEATKAKSFPCPPSETV